MIPIGNFEGLFAGLVRVKSRACQNGGDHATLKTPNRYKASKSPAHTGSVSALATLISRTVPARGTRSTIIRNLTYSHLHSTRPRTSPGAPSPSSSFPPEPLLKPPAYHLFAERACNGVTLARGSVVRELDPSPAHSRERSLRPGLGGRHADFQSVGASRAVRDAEPLEFGLDVRHAGTGKDVSYRPAKGGIMWCTI